MKEYDKLNEFLNNKGWVLECWSPLEIRSEDGCSFATGFAAQVLIHYLEIEEEC